LRKGDVKQRLMVWLPMVWLMTSDKIEFRNVSPNLTILVRNHLKLVISQDGF